MFIKAILTLVTTCLLITISLAAYRLHTILSPHRPRPTRKHGDPVHLLIILGSGGHTAEMLSMLSRTISSPDPALQLNWSSLTYRTWITSENDTLSAQRAVVFERETGSEVEAKYRRDMHAPPQKPAQIVTVPRAREIHQPLYSAPISSLRCLLASVVVLVNCAAQGRGYPDVVLCNGPATATIVVFAALVLRFFDVRGAHTQGKLRTVYVESWARVKKLSLSGVLLERVVDRFVVQWPQLAEGGKGRRRRREYLGVLV